MLKILNLVLLEYVVDLQTVEHSEHTAGFLNSHCHIFVCTSVVPPLGANHPHALKQLITETLMKNNRTDTMAMMLSFKTQCDLTQVYCFKAIGIHSCVLYLGDILCASSIV